MATLLPWTLILLNLFLLSVSGTPGTTQCPGVTLVLRRTKCGDTTQQIGQKPPKGKTHSEQNLARAMKTIKRLEALIDRTNEAVGDLTETVTSDLEERLSTLEARVLNGSEATGASHSQATQRPIQYPSNSSHGLVIETDHPTLYPGLTTEHTVNCTMDMGQSPSSLVSLASIVLGRWNSTQGEYIGIAHISALHPDRKVVVNDIGANASGHVDPKGVSFLSLQWEDPSHDAGGLYKCEANTLNVLSQSETKAVSLYVLAVEPTVDMLKVRVQELRFAVQVKDSQLQDRENSMDAQREEIESKDKIIKKQEAKLRTGRGHMCAVAEAIDVVLLEQQRFDLPSHPVSWTPECKRNLPRTCPVATDAKPFRVLEGNTAVRCDTITDGGGWIVIQRRTNADVNFYRGWQAYKEGFGRLDGNFWLGNEQIHRLTKRERYEIRVDLKFEGDHFFAVYDRFSIAGEDDLYRLHLGNYRQRSTAQDSLSYHNGRPFSTYDNDNDANSKRGNCARDYEGAWWYGNCYHSNLNGPWGGKNFVGTRWQGVSGDDSTSFTEMKIRPVRLLG